MEVVAAIKLVTVLVSLLQAGAEGIAAAVKVSGVIKARQDAGQDVTVDDLKGVIGDDDAAKAHLEAAIAAA